MTSVQQRELARATAFFGADIGDSLERVELNGGEQLFAAGDEADAMYVVVAGRVRVVGQTGDGEPLTLSELGPGQPVGEMAIITGELRQASVVAIRDSALYRLHRDDFDDLLRVSPTAMRQTLMELAQRINRPPIVGRNALQPRNIVLIGAGHDAPLQTFATALVDFLGQHSSVARVDRSFVTSQVSEDAADAPPGSDAADELLELAYRVEEENEFVIYVADASDTAWSQRVLRQADLVLAVGDANAVPTLTDLERQLFDSDHSSTLAKVDLVLVQPQHDRTPVGTTRWLAERPVSMVHHVHLQTRSHFARLARFIVGKPVGLVLSGGSARAFAHIGVLRALREASIPIDIIVGTSAGALIGAQFARGWDDTRLERENVSLFSRSRRLLDFTIPYASIISSAKFNGVLDTIFGDIRFEDLWIQYLCTTTNMTDAELRTHRRGELRQAVRASCSLPMLMPPVVEDGRLYADGGIMNNVPVDQLLEVANVGSLIVVNVTNPFYTADEDYNYKNSLPFWRVLNGRYNPFSPSLVAPGIINVLMRSLEIGTKSLERDQIAKADVYVRPDVADVPYTDASGLPGIVQAGYRAARAELADWKPEIPFL